MRQNTWAAAGQLTAVMDRQVASGVPVAALRIAYDAAGRLTDKLELLLWPEHRSLPDHTATYNADNQALTYNGLALQHDADGNLTTGPSPTAPSALVNYGWNARNQLTSGPDGATYAYDAEGHRVSLTQSGATTTFVVDPNTGLSRVLWRVKPDGKRTFYVYGGTLLYEIEETGNTVRYYHYDHLGNTIGLSDAAGKSTARLAYSAYGVTLRTTGPVDTPFRYCGAFGVQTDPNGLLHIRARYYHPHLARFLNEDPIGFAGGMNWFAYADGNPVSLSDPSGWESFMFPPGYADSAEMREGFQQGAAAAFPAGVGVAVAAFTGPVIGGAVLSAGINASSQMIRGGEISGHELATSAATGELLSGAFSAGGALVANGFKTTPMVIHASRIGGNLSGVYVPLHVAYSAGGKAAHATGRSLFSMTTRKISEEHLELFASQSYGSLRLPVVNSAAVTASGVRAFSCVIGAFSAFMRGWQNTDGTAIGHGASAINAINSTLLNHQPRFSQAFCCVFGRVRGLVFAWHVVA